MRCIRCVVGSFAFFLLNCAAADLLAPQLEEDVFMGHDPTHGVNREGHLRIITLEPGKVEGEYRRAASKDGSGVYFLSEVKEDSRLLLITTLQGEQLYRAVSPRNKDILVSLMGNDFLLKNYESSEGHTVLRGFQIPAARVAEIEKTLDEPDGTDESLFSASDETHSLSEMQRSYAKLHRSVEAALFVHASVKLGRDIGVLGSEYPAAMSLYVLAMRLAKDEESVAHEATSIRKQLIVQETCPIPTIYCSNSKSCCKKCPLGSGCLGLCGTSCTCWSWACGDCCYYQGCYDHDLCCKNYFSWACLGVWKFQCNSYSCN